MPHIRGRPDEERAGRRSGDTVTAVEALTAVATARCKPSFSDDSALRVQCSSGQKSLHAGKEDN